MSEYYVATDATIDLNQEMVDRLGVKVVPMDFILGGNAYTHYPDSRELSLAEFYQRLQKGEAASTSQIPPVKYEEFFEGMLREGRDVIYIALSSGLSGTYGAAVITANRLCEKYPERRIVCIDSLCASIGEGLLICYAAKAQADGMSFDECVRYIEETKLKVCHWFMVEDLNQLKRGGRIKSWEAVMGAALQIHPILTTDSEGRLKVASKARGIKKALRFLKMKLEEDAYDSSKQTVIIGHGNCPEYAELLKKEILEEGLVAEVIISEIGPVIGSHTGMGMCALVFIGENKNI